MPEPPGRVFDVVGLNHRLSLEAQAVFARMTEHDRQTLKCKLVRQPKNKADKNAIKVMCVDPRLEKFTEAVGKLPVHMGYLRKEVAAVIAPALDRGTSVVVSCRLIMVNAEYGWGRVRLKLKTPASGPKRKSQIST